MRQGFVLLLTWLLGHVLSGAALLGQDSHAFGTPCGFLSARTAVMSTELSTPEATTSSEGGFHFKDISENMP